VKQYEERTRSLTIYLRFTNFSSINTSFVMEINFKNFITQLVFNSPLLPIPRNNLARKRPIIPESLATPLGIAHRVWVNRELLMLWKDRPSSIVTMGKNLCSNSCVCYENENLLRNSSSKDTLHVLLITTIPREQLVRFSWNFQFLPNYTWSTYCKNITRIGDISLNNSPLHRYRSCLSHRDS
jgi:hypothetical protein